jgi:hypothetical protein
MHNRWPEQRDPTILEQVAALAALTGMALVILGTLALVLYLGWL